MMSIKKDIQITLGAISPKLSGKFTQATDKVTQWAKLVWAAICKAARAVRNAIIRFWAYLSSLSHAKRMFAVVLTLLSIFILWQLAFYSIPSKIFVSVNMCLAAILVGVTCNIILYTQNMLDKYRKTIADLQSNAEKREQDLNKIRSDLFELRNKNRRQGSARKGALRLVETIQTLGKAQPADRPKLQFIVDALTKCFDISGAVAYARDTQNPNDFVPSGHFALSSEAHPEVAHPGEGFVGQTVISGTAMTLPNVPMPYLTAVSGLGKSRSLNVYVLPFCNAAGEVVAVVEAASFTKILATNEWNSVMTELRPTMNAIAGFDKVVGVPKQPEETASESAIAPDINTNTGEATGDTETAVTSNANQTQVTKEFVGPKQTNQQTNELPNSADQVLPEGLAQGTTPTQQ